jgi:PAS domain S-box-containing protein
MSFPDPGGDGDRSATILRDSKRLVEMSRHTRLAASDARRRAGALLKRLSMLSSTVQSHRLIGTTLTAAPRPQTPTTTQRRQHDRLARPSRRQTDRRPHAADNRRVLLAGPDESWRLLMAYVFEEAGYLVYSAVDPCQTEALATRLLPDVVVVQMEGADTIEVVTRLASRASTFDIPVVVPAPSLHSTDAFAASAAGAVVLLPHDDDMEVLVGEVDSLIAVGPRTQRALKRRLLDLQELARHYTPDADGQARLRRLIDHLQVAIVAIDSEGHCIAASQGATTLTGYSHLELLTAAVFEMVFPEGCGLAGTPTGARDRRPFVATTTIVNHSGERIAVHAAAFEEIMPGLHVAALAAADPRVSGECAGDDHNRNRRPS